MERKIAFHKIAIKVSEEAKDQEYGFCWYSYKRREGLTNWN